MAVVSSQLQERPAVAYFIRRVEALSNRNIRINVDYNWKSPDPDAEQQVVKATAAGSTIDLGVVGSRVFDTMRIRSLQALSAPMLIDSYPLENAVVRSDMAERMLTPLSRVGVAGLALIANGLRKPVAVARPLLTRRDWRGKTFGTYLSDVQENAIRALGATPLVAFSSLRVHFLQTRQLKGFEFNVLSYYINSYWDQAPYITANVNLWPQVDVLVANPGVLAQLTSQQRGWLQEAAREATDRSSAMMAAAEQGVVRAICKRGTRFVDASRPDLVSLRHAFAPVYSRLEEDRQTRLFIARIEKLKRSTAAGPALAVPKSCLAR
jgi:TRAP-type C4-dicarboxylate transport system substrate-binding protein